MKKTRKIRNSSAAALLWVMILAAVLWTGSAMAASKKPKIKSVEYQGKGKVEVDFAGNVSWKKAKVTVKDTEGKSYKTTIIEKDRDDISFKVKKAVEGMDYEFTISGISLWKKADYTSVSGTFRIAAAKEVLVERVEYDAQDKEVSFEFQGTVKWKKAKVTIKAGGKNMVKRVEETSRDEIEVKVKALTPGKKYSYTISGVARKGTKKYQTIKGSFVA